MIFDVGAYRGDKTVQYLREGHDVVAFEPNPAMYKRLRRLHKRFGNRITVVNKALGASPAKVKLSVCTRTPTISTCSERWKQGRFRNHTWDTDVMVEQTTLDEAIAEFGLPDFIKIDVEGYEVEVLNGLSQPVKELSFEFAREFLDSALKCLEMLKKLGYSEFNVKFGIEPDYALRWTTAQALGLILEQKPDKVWGDIYARLT